MIQKFSKKTKDVLGYYVYVYSDPDSKEPFYVGKGKNDRVFNHLSDKSETDKVIKIKEIEQQGKEPIIEILAHGLDEETALKVEAAAIDLIGIDNLTNKQRGYNSADHGKIEVSRLDARYKNEQLNFTEVTDNLLFIKVNKLYRNDMSDLELYDITRGYWKINIENAKKVDFVLSVYEGMILEVYEVMEWLPALSTFTTRQDDLDKDSLKKRYEFIGRIADDKIRSKYVNKSVSDYFKKGEQNSIKYFWGKKEK